MKPYSLIVIVFLALSSGCLTPSFNWDQHLSSISGDSLYYLQNSSWQPADTNQIPACYGKEAKVCTLEVVKADKGVLLHVSTSAVKAANDSIYLFMPADNGAIVTIGRLNGGRIASRAQILNGSSVRWTKDNSLYLGDKLFEPLLNTDVKWFRDVIGGYCYDRGPDSMAVVLGGP